MAARINATTVIPVITQHFHRLLLAPSMGSKVSVIGGVEGSEDGLHWLFLVNNTGEALFDGWLMGTLTDPPWLLPELVDDLRTGIWILPSNGLLFPFDP